MTLAEALALAHQHHRNGQGSAAEQLCREILAVIPNQFDALNLLNTLTQPNAASINMDQAIAAYCQPQTASSPIDHAAAEHHVQRGNALRAEGKPHEAAAEFARALAIHSASSPAHNSMGLIFLDQGRFDDAVASFERAAAFDPSFFKAPYNLGFAHQIHGKTADAIAYYRRALAIQPDLVEAHTNLAHAYQALGDLPAAAAAFRDLLTHQPEHVAAHANLASVLFGLNQHDEAIASLRRAVTLQPDAADLHKLLGTNLHSRGLEQDAAQCFYRVIELNPDDVDAHMHLGASLYASESLDEALFHFCRVIEIQPESATAYFNIGAVLRSKGETDTAVSAFQTAVNLKPDFAKGHLSLGHLYFELGKLDDAFTAFDLAVQFDPELVEAHAGLGVCLKRRGDFAAAEVCMRRAVELSPDLASAHNELGAVLHAQKKLDEAVESCQRALAIDPSLAAVHHNLGCTYEEMDRFEEAAACFRRALDLDPSFFHFGSLINLLQPACLWNDLPELIAKLGGMLDDESQAANPMSPFAFLTLPIASTAAQQRRQAESYVACHVRSAIESGRVAALPRLPGSGPKITLGYLSSDFHSHATAYLLAGLIEKHDRTMFRVIGYSMGIDDDSPMRRRLKHAFDAFVDLHAVPHVDAAQRIASDGVDILIDLKGYTGNARPQIVALRPAPIQVNYLGYPGTMGADFIDAILVDDFIVPPDQQAHFSERIVYLPGCYQVNDSQRAIAARTPTRQECGLPESGFVFCCFNSNYKITPDLFDVWMQLLRGVPASVLWLVESHSHSMGNLRREAEKRGVSGARLVFAPFKSLDEHLARYRLADLFLDTFPVNAHTTASDALWVGCPVVTIAGATFVSRVAGSLLRAVGLSDLITTNVADYEALAFRLATDSQMLDELRTRLQNNVKKSLLFDTETFTRNIERAFIDLVETARRSHA